MIHIGIVLAALWVNPRAVALIAEYILLVLGDEASAVAMEIVSFLTMAAAMVRTVPGPITTVSISIIPVRWFSRTLSLSLRLGPLAMPEVLVIIIVRIIVIIGGIPLITLFPFTLLLWFTHIVMLWKKAVA